MTNAAQFNATGERLTRSTGPSPNAAYTVAFWVRIDTNRSADYQTLFTFLMTNNEWESIMLDASNRLAIEAGVGGSGNRVNAASAFGTGTWRYVALVRSSTTSLKAYVNGTETLSLTTNVSTRTGSVFEFAFGSDEYDEDSRSSIAYARAWTAALNTTELAAESASASAVKTSDLWGDWPMQADGDDDTANARHLTASGTVSYVTDGPVLPINGALTKTLAALTSSASGTVEIAGAVSKTLAALTCTATIALDAGTGEGALSATLAALTSAATSTAAIAGQAAATLAALAVSATGASEHTGALTATLGALTVAARGYHLESVCIGGTIQVDATNPRYFSNGEGVVLLSGFHTWETLVDHGDSDPPDAFDYDAFLDALVADGCNFIKLWACESLRDWCDAVKYFYPYVYERTGPGNAADGKAKVDLTSFNAAYFARLRERAIEAGNRGMFVCVQLFQGWQITQKGYSAGAPGTYHPFNAANNINSIDGDIDNDGQVGETRDITWTAVYDLQKAYVRAVVDAVNDLDHVIYEISNEEDEVDNASGQTKVAWQHALIDYIHTYEAGLPKQHPVGMTVQWPSGSDTDLFSSNAEWISPKDAANVGSVSASNGDKVILWDTDHVIGLTDEHEWIWMAVTRGCNPLYMDEWDGDFYGTDKRLTAANVKIRDNLGYVQSWAAANVDLLNATPQSSLASTGYCLAKTTGQVQVLAYQPTSGNFTVNLTSYAGTYTVEWLRPATGSTQGGSDVTGGAVRALTPPWAGEDAVVFLQLSNIDGAVTVALAALTSTAAGIVALAATATVTLGALTAAGTATLEITGAASVTLGDLVASATGAVAITVAASATLDHMVVASTATLDIAGTLASTLAAVTSVATGELVSGASGEVAATLGSLTSAASGTLDLAAVLAATLAALSSTATGALDLAGALDAALDALIADATGVGGNLPLSADVAVTLGSLSSAAAGTLDLVGAANVTLSNLTGTAAGAVTLTAAVNSILSDATLTGTGVAVLIIATVAGSVRGPAAGGNIYGPKTNGSIGRD